MLKAEYWRTHGDLQQNGFKNLNSKKYVNLENDVGKKFPLNTLLTKLLSKSLSQTHIHIRKICSPISAYPSL